MIAIGIGLAVLAALAMLSFIVIADRLSHKPTSLRTHRREENHGNRNRNDS